MTHVKIRRFNMKYVDDLTLIESRMLTQQPHIQEALNDFLYLDKKQKYETKSCKVLYNDSDVLQTPPQPEPLFIDNVELNVVTEAKIFGVVIQQPYFASNKKVQQKTVHAS